MSRNNKNGFFSNEKLSGGRTAKMKCFFLFAVGKCLAEFTGKRSYYELRILPLLLTLIFPLVIPLINLICFMKKVG